MALPRKYQARSTVTAAQHSHLVNSAAALRKQKIELLSAKPNPDGTVTVTFCGHGLGKNAMPVPPAASVAIAADGTISVTPIE
jgi:hypothetical protein